MQERLYSQVGDQIPTHSSGGGRSDQGSGQHFEFLLLHGHTFLNMQLKPYEKFFLCKCVCIVKFKAH